MTLSRRWFRPGTAAEHRAYLARSLAVAQASVVLAVAAAVIIGVALVARDRRLEGVTLAVGGVTAAATVNAVLGYIGWRLQQSVDAAALAADEETAASR